MPLVLLGGLLQPGVALAADHARWGALLSAHVASGRVDYAGIEAAPADLDAWLATVASASGDQPLGFWIDAYNALVIKALIDAPALPAHVTDLPGFFDARKYPVAGVQMTLNELETRIRTASKDPRVHFALNCGARSCPPLAASPFPEDPAALDRLLSERTSAFLDGPGLSVDDARKEIRLTKLMDWYKDDFVQKEGSVEAFLRRWVTDPAKKAQLEAALASGYAIVFQSYDWTPDGS